jgi:hypothetical protein
MSLLYQPDIDDDTEEAITAAVLSIITLLLVRRRRRRHRRQQREWKWRPAYECRQFSFSLDLIQAGRARAWLRFIAEKIIELAHLLHLDNIEFRRRIQVDSTTALCVGCARLSLPHDGIYLLISLADRFHGYRLYSMMQFCSSQPHSQAAYNHDLDTTSTID